MSAPNCFSTSVRYAFMNTKRCHWRATLHRLPRHDKRVCRVDTPKACRQGAARLQIYHRRRVSGYSRFKQSYQRIVAVVQCQNHGSRRRLAVDSCFQRLNSTAVHPILRSVGYGQELKITRTYRNVQEIIDIAGTFVQKNSAQIKRSLSLRSESSIRLSFTRMSKLSIKEKSGRKVANITIWESL